MYLPVLENMGKITAATVEMQQEMFKKWFSLWPGFPTAPAFPMPWGDQTQSFQKKWIDAVGQVIRRQRETVEAQFKLGQQNIEKAFQLSEAKSPEEFRARTQEFWQKCIESMRQTSEAQIRDFQVAVEKWFELMAPGFPSN